MMRSASARMRRSGSDSRLEFQSSRHSLHNLDAEGGRALTARGASKGEPALTRQESRESTLQSDGQEARPCSVRVVVRFRPELPDGQDHVDLRATPRAQPTMFVPDSQDGTVTSVDLQQQFQFDHVFDPEHVQEEIYLSVGQPVVDDVVEGYHGTILAYGQTGSGKTYSIFGPPGQHGLELQGLLPRAASELFDRLAEEERSSGSQFEVSCSFLELYCEQMRDLMQPKNQGLQLKQLPGAGFYVENLTHRTVASAGEVMQLVRGGLKLRASAPNAMNNHSSRSHAVFTMNVQQQCEDGVRHRKLTLVDLAGSEKVRKSGSTGDMLEEAKKINSSLSALGNVIDALADRRPHVPYRDSRLTRILEDSIGGNCRTTLLVACSPSPSQAAETLSSLRFAARAKKVQNFVKLNTGPMMNAQDRQLLQRISQLQNDLASAHRAIEQRLAGGSTPGSLLEAQHRHLQRSLSKSNPFGPQAAQAARETLSTGSGSANSSLNGAASSPPMLLKSASMKSTSASSYSGSGKSMGLRHESHISIGLPAAIEKLEKTTARRVQEVDAKTLAKLQAQVPNKGASREDIGSDEKANRFDDFEGDAAGWRRHIDAAARQHVLDFGNGGGRSGFLSETSTATGSTKNILSYGSLPMPSSPSVTPLSSWRNLDENAWNEVRRTSGLSEQDKAWYLAELELERNRNGALSEELVRRESVTRALQMELHHSRSTPSTALQSPRLRALAPPPVLHRTPSALRQRSSSPAIAQGEPQLVACRVGPAIPTGERRSITPVRRGSTLAALFRSSSTGRRDNLAITIGPSPYKSSQACVSSPSAVTPGRSPSASVVASPSVMPAADGASVYSPKKAW